MGCFQGEFGSTTVCQNLPGYSNVVPFGVVYYSPNQKTITNPNNSSGRNDQGGLPNIQTSTHGDLGWWEGARMKRHKGRASNFENVSAKARQYASLPERNQMA